MQDNDPLLDNIINTTLQMAFSSSIIAFLFGTLIGLLVAFNDFPGKRIVVMFMRTLMGLPPVVVGIIVYVLFSGTGPFGNLGLFYSVKLMSFFDYRRKQVSAYRGIFVCFCARDFGSRRSADCRRKHSLQNQSYDHCNRPELQHGRFFDGDRARIHSSDDILVRKLRRRVITIRIETKKTCLICLAKKHTTGKSY